MTVDAVALFAHIVGVAGLFIGLGLQWLTTIRLRSARTVAQAREWGGLVGLIGRIGPIAGALTLLAGVYLTVTVWGMTPWILVSLVAMAFMIAVGMALVNRRLAAIQRGLLAIQAFDAAIPEALRRQIVDPVLWVATHVVSGVMLGIVFLMTTKLDLGGSLLAMAVALLLGGGLGVVTAQSGRKARLARGVMVRG